MTKEKKQCVQKRFREELGLNIDKPRFANVVLVYVFAWGFVKVYCKKSQTFFISMIASLTVIPIGRFIR